MILAPYFPCVSIGPTRPISWSFGRVRRHDGASASLSDALRHPHFTLYFGRKACPLGVPLDPRVVEADDPRVGNARPILQAGHRNRQNSFAICTSMGCRRSWRSISMARAIRANRMRVERRRDALESRRRWQFGLRSEALVDGRKQ